jgi:hypothetical protein
LNGFLSECKYRSPILAKADEKKKEITMVPRKATDSLTIHMFKELFLKRKGETNNILCTVTKEYIPRKLKKKKKKSL